MSQIIRAVKRSYLTDADFAGLSRIVQAKDQADGNSHLELSFLSVREAVQTAIDQMAARGGGDVIIRRGGKLDDYVRVPSNIRLIFERELILADYTTIGAALLLEGDNIKVVDSQIDCSGIYAGGSGQNGIGITHGKNIRVRDGYVKGCARGQDFVTPGSTNDGGKAFQVEAGAGSDIHISGVSIADSFVAMSTIRDGGIVQPYRGIVFSDMTVHDCAQLLIVRQVNIGSKNGLEHAVTLNNFQAVNVGSYEGAMHFSRAANVLVCNGSISNAAPVDSMVRGNLRYSRIESVDFNGDCTAGIINLLPSEYAPDQSYMQENTVYDFKHNGVTPYVAVSGAPDQNNVLQNCTIRARLSQDVTAKLMHDELRNGNSDIELSQGGRTIKGTTPALFVSGKAKFADFNAGINVLASGVTFTPILPRSTDPNCLDAYQELAWAPTLSSDTGVNGTLAYTSEGTATRIGNAVYVRGEIRVTNVGGRTGRIRIGGLPWASKAGGNPLMSAILEATNYPGNSVVVPEIGRVSYTELLLAVVTPSVQDTVMQYLQFSTLTNTSVIRFAGTYPIASDA